MGLVEVTQVVELEESNSDDHSVGAGAGSLDAEAGESRIVQVIHESVREFFLHNDGFELLGLSFSPIVDGYLSILNTCLDYIAVCELDDLVLARERTRPSRQPFDEVEMGRHSFAREAVVWHETRLSRPRSRSSSVASFGSASSMRYSQALSGVNQNPPPKNLRISSPKPTAFPSSPSTLGEHPEPAYSPMETLEKYLSEQSQDVSELSHGLLNSEFSSVAGSISLSVGQKSYLLEDYPALLSYVLTTFFIHVRSAERAGGNLRPIWDRMHAGMWERWSSLEESIPMNTTLAKWLELERSTGLQTGD